MMLPIIVTIDGPAGTGKSSAASQLADRLGFDMLDTGAMYRAVALLAVEQKIDPHHESALALAMDLATLDVDFLLGLRRFSWTSEMSAIAFATQMSRASSRLSHRIMKFVFDL